MLQTKENLSKLENELDVLKKLRNVCEEMKGFEDILPIVNAGLFMHFFLYDLFCVAVALSNSKSDWEKRFHIRILSLILHESINPIRTLIVGRELRNVFKKYSNNEMNKKLNNASQSFQNFLKRNNKLLKNDINNIRNFTMGHRNKDVKKIFQIIENININEFQQKLISEVIDFEYDLTSFLIDAGKFLVRESYKDLNKEDQKKFQSFLNNVN